MPIYEFSCESCGHVFDKIADMDVTKTICPKCNKVSYKSAGSWLFNSTNLPNGFARPAK